MTYAALKAPLNSNQPTLKSATFGIPKLVLPGCGTAWHKSGTSLEIRNGWQPYCNAATLINDDVS